MKNVFLLLMVFVVVGCSTTSELPDKEFAKTMSGQFVPVSLFIDDGTGGSGNAYEYDRYIHGRFIESNLFEKIGTYSQGWPVAIFVEYGAELEGKKSAHTANFLASAATLFLLPVQQDIRYNLKVTVAVNGNAKEYFYTNRVKSISTIANAVGKDAFKPLGNLLNHFFAELQQEGALPKTGSSQSKAQGTIL